MTKTITELQPMIYGDLFARTKRRAHQRDRYGKLVRRIVLPLYMVLGTLIVFDAGVTPWDFRFWVIFLPFFGLGEMAVAALSQAGVKKEDGPEDYTRVGAALWFDGIMCRGSDGEVRGQVRRNRATPPRTLEAGAAKLRTGERRSDVALCS